MHLGLYTAPLHGKPIDKAFTIVSSAGLDAVELNSGGFLFAAHIPVKEIDEDPASGRRWLRTFDGTGAGRHPHRGCREGGPAGLNPSPWNARGVRRGGSAGTVMQWR